MLIHLCAYYLEEWFPGRLSGVSPLAPSEGFLDERTKD